jgi:hypothetical protein
MKRREPRRFYENQAVDWTLDLGKNRKAKSKKQAVKRKTSTTKNQRMKP